MPFLPPSPPLGQLFGLGAATLLLGLMLFNSPVLLPALLDKAKAWTQPGDGGSGPPGQRLVTGLK